MLSDFNNISNPIIVQWFSGTTTNNTSSIGKFYFPVSFTNSYGMSTVTEWASTTYSSANFRGNSTNIVEKTNAWVKLHYMGNNSSFSSNFLAIAIGFNNFSNIIVQWGMTSATTTTANLKQVLFPITFNNVYIVLNTNSSYDASFFSSQQSNSSRYCHLTYTAGVNSISATGFKEQSIYGFNWIAVGS